MSSTAIQLSHLLAIPTLQLMQIWFSDECSTNKILDHCKLNSESMTHVYVSREYNYAGCIAGMEVSDGIAKLNGLLADLVQPNLL